MRGNSALDIALWDLFGKVTGQPIAQLLGGFTRDSIRTYNTCAGSAYMRRDAGQSARELGAVERRRGVRRPQRFLHRADELAHELLAEGITAMKIWPFDLAAEANGGVDISAADLKTALKPFEKIRSRRRRPHGHHGRVPFAVAAPARHAHRQGARAVRHEAGTRIRSRWTAWRASSATPRFRPRRSAPRKRSAAAGPSAICSRPARRASSCSTSPGAAGCRRRARSPRWPRPGTCRSRRTTAPGRWCCAPRPTSR